MVDSLTAVCRFVDFAVSKMRGHYPAQIEDDHVTTLLRTDPEVRQRYLDLDTYSKSNHLPSTLIVQAYNGNVSAAQLLERQR